MKLAHFSTDREGCHVGSDVYLCFREASLHDDMMRNSHRKTNHKKLRQLESSAVNERASSDRDKPHTAGEAAATYTTDNDVSALSRRSVNAENALKRIESKQKTSQTKSVSDAAVNARTVFVGNVALSIDKKARHQTCLPPLLNVFY